MTTPTGHTSAICARKVIDTNVYDASGTKIGEVKDIVLDKLSNNIMFAVVGFGGFLGIGEKYHPIPWSELDYSKIRNGYTVNLSREQLDAAPSTTLDELTRDDGRAYRDLVAHYKSRPFWH
jgi:sporulation protein YlmC with PRC-barrel domain